MNREAAAIAAQSVRENIEIAEEFLRDPSAKDRALELEVIARCNKAEAALGNLRAAIVDRSEHVTGEREVRA